MSKITEFKIGKGRTAQTAKEEEWTKKYLEFTVKMPEQSTDKDLQDAILTAEYAIDNFLGQPAAPQIPEFNSEELMKHDWKGKRISENEWAKGSLAWGWDFRDKFSEAIIKVLGKGPLTIDQYEFTLGDVLVSAKKKEKKGREKQK
jgi:hypothetical protein